MFEQAELDPSAGTIDFVIPASDMDVARLFSVMKQNKEKLGTFFLIYLFFFTNMLYFLNLLLLFYFLLICYIFVGVLEWAVNQMSLEEVFLKMVATDESQF